LLPLHRRRFDVFLSHAHADAEAVARVLKWLELADVKVWFDGRDFAPGARVGMELLNSVDDCRGAIVILSPSALRSGWVGKECDVLIEHSAMFPDFQIIPVCIEPCELPSALRTHSRLDLPGGKVDLAAAEALLTGIFRLTQRGGRLEGPDVYVSRSWRDAEAELPNRVCRQLVDAGFRLIGDSKDQVGFLGGHRVDSILASCGAIVAILPFRSGEASGTSPYMLREIEIGLERKVPLVVVAEQGVQVPEFGGARVLCLTAASEFAENPGDWLREAWTSPPRPHYVFLASSIDDAERRTTTSAARLVERVTAMRCVLGDEIRDGSVQETITNQICGAFLVIADLADDRLNTCIEAGVARGAGVTMHLLARGPRRKPPFLFRDLQVWFYADDCERLATIHKIVRPYRRRVLNDELPGAR
jgi:hypothetical protein